jgi:hypothetical protein
VGKFKKSLKNGRKQGGRKDAPGASGRQGFSARLPKALRVIMGIQSKQTPPGSRPGDRFR